jgi:hypothetical protein
MAEPSKDPTNLELLKRIDALEDENSRLKAQVMGEFTRVYDLLWPLVDKAFPKLRDMQSKMDEVVPPCGADPRADRQR